MSKQKTGMENSKEVIPREFAISNPSPVISPQSNPPIENDAYQCFSFFSHFLKDELPKFTIDPSSVPSPPLRLLEQTLFTQKISPVFLDLLFKEILLVFQNHIFTFSSSQSLSSWYIIHTQLYFVLDLGLKYHVSPPLIDMGEMLLAETLDYYYVRFSEVIDKKWAKTVHIDDLIKIFLSKELQKLKGMHENTFKMFSSLMLQKLLESAPQSAFSNLNNWAAANNIQI